MWLFTQDGFLSIVRHRDDPEVLLVRARDRASLEEFGAKVGLPAAEIVTLPETDYRYRIVCGDGAVLSFLAQTVRELDYPNFKARVSQTRGPRWHSLLLRIWSATRSLQASEARSGSDG